MKTRVGRTAWFAVLLLATSCACARTHPCEPRAPTAVVDLSGEMRLGGRFNMCTACAVAHQPTAKEPWKTVGLTAAHCLDLKPFDNVPLYSVSWSDGDGHSGLAIAHAVDTWRDLGWLIPNGEEEFPHVYGVAAQAPSPGDILHAIGPDFRDRKRALGDRVYAPTVIRVRANHIVMNENAGPGSSGGCVLNDQNEVVGVVSGWMATDEPGGEVRVGYVVGVWGDLLLQRPWRPEPPKAEPKAEDPDDIGTTLRRLFGDAVTEIR